MKTTPKTKSHRILTIVLTPLAALVLLANSSTLARARHDEPARRAGQAARLADLPPETRAAITESLKREEVLAPDTFTPRAELTSSDGNIGNQLSIAGDTVLVRFPPTYDVFAEPASGWVSGVESAKLTRSDGGILGAASAIAGNTVVVGTEGDQFSPGAAYLFVKPPGGWSGTVTESATLIASDGTANDRFGFSVALSGDTVVVGNLGKGATYLFVKPPGGWQGSITESAKLSASDGIAVDSVLAIDGNTVVGRAGSYGSAQSVYVFVKPAIGWAGTITESAKLLAAGGESDDGFGDAVAIDRDTVVVGAHFRGTLISRGAAYIFTKPPGGWTGSLTSSATLAPNSDGTFLDDFFGTSVAIAGNTVVVGAPNDTISTDRYQGSAYIFVEPEGGWTGTIVGNSKLFITGTDLFGYTVGIAGDTVVVGRGGSSGVVSVYSDDSPDVSYVMDYTYRFRSGQTVSGSDTLLEDGAFLDSAGGGGTWSFPQSGRITLQYQGEPCDALLTGRFRSPTKVGGALRCTDGSGEKGSWQATILPE